jgi:hypothetical protein
VKLGAENSKKTLAAGALLVVAIIMFVHMLSGSGGSSTPASTPTATAAPTSSPAPRQPRRAPARKGARGSKEATSGPVTPSLDPRLHLAQLQDTEDTAYDGKGRNIFMETEEPKIEKPIAPPFKQPDKLAQVPTVPAPILPPPINLKFFGFASGPDHKRVFLAQGDDVFVASEGEIVQRRYKIVKINNNNIEVLDVLSNNRQTIPLTAG